MINILYDTSQTYSEAAGCGYYTLVNLKYISKLDISNNFFFKFVSNFGDFYNNPRPPETNPFNFGMYYNLEKKFDIKTLYNDVNFESYFSPIDIIHSNNYWAPSFKTKSKFCYTLYDVSFLDKPELTSSIIRGGCQENTLKAVLHADHIVTISKFSKKRILNYFKFLKEKDISIIYPSSKFDDNKIVSDSKNLPKSIIPNKFLLSVGTIEPRKNYNFLLEVYKKYKKRIKNYMPLVIVGRQGWISEKFDNVIKDYGLRNDVLWLNNINDKELKWLYQNCFLNLFPSFYEGFGLPILEAAKLSKITLSNNIGTNKEIIDFEDLSLDFNHEIWVDKIIEISSNLQYKKSLEKKAFLSVQKFDPKISAKRLINIYNKL